MRRTATKSLAKVFQKNASEKVGAAQHDLGKQQRAELVRKKPAAASAARPHQGVLSLDLTVAFAKARRSVVLRSAQQLAPDLQAFLPGIVDGAAEAHCKLADGALKRTLWDGLDQGCPLSPMVFCFSTIQ